MGKDLKGKELGRGLSQRKDGRYSARLKLQNGDRPEKYFDKLSDARRWLTDTKYHDEHNIKNCKDITMDQWFDYWIDKCKKGKVENSTLYLYIKRYNKHIKPHLGSVKLENITSVMCQDIISNLDETDMRYSTKVSIKKFIKFIFDDAIMNNFLTSNPVNKKIVPIKNGEDELKIRVLTRSEQAAFLKASKNTFYENLLRFALLTGMRSGEILGLTWDDIDFENNNIYVNKQIVLEPMKKEFMFSKTKNKKNRDIPMTQEIVRLLKRQRVKWKEFVLKGCTPVFDGKELVFFNKKGQNAKTQTINLHIRKICKMANIKQIHVHILRHTFATRAIENGMKPHVLQDILGHSDIKITFGYYVHTTDEERRSEMNKTENII